MPSRSQDRLYKLLARKRFRSTGDSFTPGTIPRQLDIPAPTLGFALNVTCP